MVAPHPRNVADSCELTEITQPTQGVDLAVLLFLLDLGVVEVEAHPFLFTSLHPPPPLYTPLHLFFHSACWFLEKYALCSQVSRSLAGPCRMALFLLLWRGQAVDLAVLLLLLELGVVEIEVHRVQ